MPDERFMRHHYGANGYTDSQAEYETAYAEFETFWKAMPYHLREDDRYRAMAVQAFLFAKGFRLGGARI